VAPAFPWGVTSSSAHFQWPEVALEQKAPSWGSVFHKSTTPAGHYRRTSQQIGALHTSTAPDSAFANMCRSPTMTRVRYLDAPSQPRNEHSSSIMKHASRSNYTMTPGEEELLREAELSYTSKMYGALLTSSEHASASSALASQSLNAFRSRQTATHTTNGVFHKSMPNAALGQQMVRTFTHSKLLDASLSDRLGSKPMRVQMANADERGAASHRTRYWRLRDADGSSRVLDLGAGSSATPPQPPPPVPALLRMPTLRRFVRDPKSIYATDFTNDAVSALA